jgi:NTP pyrophosphatase (non-canonical NTP hydrolase)
MGLAREAAQRFNHQYIGTEHLLLGLLEEGNGVAAQVFRNLQVTEDRLRQEIERVAPVGPTMVSLGQLPFTPRTKRVLELTSEEAIKLHHNYIGTEHLLLGMIREVDGVAARVLVAVGLTEEMLRDEIMDLLCATVDKPDPLTVKQEFQTMLRAETATNFDRYQQFTKTTAVFPGTGIPGFNGVAYLTFGLTGEAGETSEKMKKRYRLGGPNAFLPGSVVSYDGKEETYEQFRENVKKELGDVLWYVAGLADSFGLRLSEVVDGNVEKLSKRKVDGTLKGSGDNR